MDRHGQPKVVADGAPVVLIGNPNMGKPALFGRFTGRYVTVSNCPGTAAKNRGRPPGGE